MKDVKASAYLGEVRPTAKKLLGQLLAKYEYASILCVDAQGKNYRVQRSGTVISDEPLYCNRGFVVRFLAGGKIYEHSFSSLSDADIPDILAKAEQLTSSDVYRSENGYEDRSTHKPCDEPCVLDRSTTCEIDPEEFGDESIVSSLTDVRAKTLAADERVFDAIARFTFQKYSKMFLSKNKDMTENVMWSAATLLTLTKKGDKIKDSYCGASCLGGAEIIEKLREKGIAKTVKNATDLLDAQQMIPGEYECICAPDVTGMIVHEAFGHGVEMDMFVKDRALAREYIGKYVASELVTMRDTACAVDQSATFFFDDEGNLSTDTLIIDRGILVGGICDEVAANALGIKPTGNGRRESFEKKAYTRMTNTFFEGGKDKTEDMIASVKYGFLLEEARSGMEDPKNWGIQCMVTIAREIKDGKLTGKIFSPVVLTGYVPDLLSSISMMSENTDLFGTGYCGKGHKEWVKVSDGGPYIKAKITLG